MKCEVLAIGTELLLGQIVDTNSAWIGEQLAASGIDSFEHRAIGDNQTRIVAALRDQLSRADAVLICGGLGPTQDDLTRDAIAELMGVELVRDMELAENIASMFRVRLRDMPQNNLRQADIPAGGSAIPNPIGTAPGLLCEFDGKVIYAVPGVPYEMQLMVTEHVIPDLLRRSGSAAAIVSRSLKTWGTSESGLAEQIAQQSGCGPDRIGNRRTAGRDVGLSQVVLRHVAQANAKHRRDVLGQRHVAHELDAHQLCDRVACEIVLRRSEAAADQDRVGTRQLILQRGNDASLVVADRPVFERVNSRRGELLPDPRAVGVDDLAQEQFGADREDFTFHPRILPLRSPTPPGSEFAAALPEGVFGTFGRRPALDQLVAAQSLFLRALVQGKIVFDLGAHVEVVTRVRE
ncbi:MAG TPA: molybdopterin-binding protein, partial [Acidimicrobiia bacterium]|nr:molybdopterin-binding protein [Acidimicrobiia bacterium]